MSSKVKLYRPRDSGGKNVAFSSNGNTICLNRFAANETCGRSETFHRLGLFLARLYPLGDCGGFKRMIKMWIEAGILKEENKLDKGDCVEKEKQPSNKRILK